MTEKNSNNLPGNLQDTGVHLTGVKAHRWQRISALYLALFTPLLALSSLMDFLDSAAIFVTGFLAVIMVFIHAWVGGRDILIDYLPRSTTGTWLTLYRLFLVVAFMDFVIIAFIFLLTEGQ